MTASSEAGVSLPEFRGQHRGRPVTVAYDGIQDALVLRYSDHGQEMTMRLQTYDPLSVKDGVFTWSGGRIEPVDDDFGLAVALAHVLNARRGKSPSERMLGKPMPGAPRWQYAIVNTGSFKTAERMTEVLATAGAGGWELISVYDKASNWLGGLEKGFMMMKRPVPDDVEPEEWCITFTN